MAQKIINKPILYKAIGLGVIMLLMLIPLGFVDSTISDREQYRNEAFDKIAASWGGEALINAPILNVPYEYFEQAANPAAANTANAPATILVKKTAFAKFAPSVLDTDIKIKADTRYIGIFEMPVYTAEVTMRGRFDNISNSDDLSAFGRGKSFVSLETNMLKGISTPEFLWNGKEKSFEPKSYGAPSLIIPQYERRYEYYSSEALNLQAVSSEVNFADIQKNGGEFELKFSIKGSVSLRLVPLGKTNHFTMSSDWTNPNFSGAFLPDNKSIDEKGFRAEWNINYLASGISTRFDRENLGSAVFATQFIVPVDNYRNAKRAVKYGILFIALTFAVCFVFELANKKPIHPIQYLLVGFAMVVFYLLLLSVSEFMSFALSYLIASAATVSMITAYAKMGIVKEMTKQQLLIVALSLGLLYLFLYVLLGLQDMALLYGSIGLFVVLGVIMYMTRNIVWYEEIKNEL